MLSNQQQVSSWSTITLPLIVLTVITCITQLSTLAYTADQSFLSILGPTLLVLLLVTVPTAWVGLYFGPRIGLGAPLLIALLSRQAGSGRRLLSESRIAIGLGIAIGILMLLIDWVMRPYLPAETPEWGFRGVIGGLLGHWLLVTFLSLHPLDLC